MFHLSKVKFVVRQISQETAGSKMILSNLSAASYVDRILGLASTYSPEGFLTTFSAFTTTYFGLVYFYISKNFKKEPYKKFTTWLTLGIVLVAVGHFIDYYFYFFNKRMYTTSFALFTSGMCGIFLSLLSIIMDEFGYSSILIIFVWVGRNPFVLYFVPSLIQNIMNIIEINGKSLFWLIFKYSMIEKFGGAEFAMLIYCLAYLLIWVILSFIMNHKEIYIKL
jgi:predicted acyltransferase